MAKSKTNYYQLLQEQLEYTRRAAHFLSDSFHSFELEELDRMRQELHIIERQADLKANGIQDLLISEFITPIDREDLSELVQLIDSVTDAIDDVLIRVYIYNVQSIHESAIQFADLISSSADTLYELACEFPNFRKSTTIHDMITKLNLFEEDGDAMYTDGMAALFRNDSYSPLEIIAWSNIYEVLEECCDAIEHVCDLYERIIMKNM